MTDRSIEVTTAAPESKTYEGTLLVADPITNLVVLETRVKGAGETAGRSTDYRVLAISRIRNFQIMSLASGDVNLARPQPQISEIDLKRLHKRCDDRVAALKEQERNRGKGVTTEGQALFDALRKMYVSHPSQVNPEASLTFNGTATYTSAGITRK